MKRGNMKSDLDSNAGSGCFIFCNIWEFNLPLRVNEDDKEYLDICED